jgi:hypothetical protein
MEGLHAPLCHAGRAFLDSLPERENLFVALTTLSRDEWEQYGGD